MLDIPKMIELLDVSDLPSKLSILEKQREMVLRDMLKDKLGDVLPMIVSNISNMGDVESMYKLYDWSGDELDNISDRNMRVYTFNTLDDHIMRLVPYYLHSSTCKLGYKSVGFPMVPRDQMILEMIAGLDWNKALGGVIWKS